MTRIILFSFIFLSFNGAFADDSPSNGDPILKWYKTICVEVTPSNELIQEIHNKQVCRCKVGTAYAMSGDLCGEFTTDGVKLRWLKDKSLCSVAPGIVTKRCD